MAVVEDDATWFLVCRSSSSHGSRRVRNGLSQVAMRSARMSILIQAQKRYIQNTSAPMLPKLATRCRVTGLLCSTTPLDALAVILDGGIGTSRVRKVSPSWGSSEGCCLVCRPMVEGPAPTNEPRDRPASPPWGISRMWIMPPGLLTRFCYPMEAVSRSCTQPAPWPPRTCVTCGAAPRD